MTRRPCRCLRRCVLLSAEQYSDRPTGTNGSMGQWADTGGWNGEAELSGAGGLLVLSPEKRRGRPVGAGFGFGVGVDRVKPPRGRGWI